MSYVIGIYIIFGPVYYDFWRESDVLKKRSTEVLIMKRALVIGYMSFVSIALVTALIIGARNG
ncbi:MULTISPECIES: hypothetical protein [Rahnella]|jgi:hypothetical protein|uniref:Uncharacterized protein n=1 Tax=Rahnella perminowiae TaxID=2816244 RepID=A0ABS6L525_9GAMM|nr:MULTISPECIES: hypothetical protein [Rahnella]MBU9836520.1 hypothetical protein [Rahnella perminowiae]